MDSAEPEATLEVVPEGPEPAVLPGAELPAPGSLSNGRCQSQDVGSCRMRGESDFSYEGRDSDFGLSDRQLEALWEEFREQRGVCRERKLTLTEDVQTSEKRDSDFGISDAQLQALMSGCKSSEDDKVVSKSRCTSEENTLLAAAATEGAEGDTSKEDQQAAIETEIAVDPIETFRERKSFQTLDQFLEEKAPPLDPRCRAMIISSRELDGFIWYLVKVEAVGQVRFFMKQFEDFQELDLALRDWLTSAAVGDSSVSFKLPELPNDGFLGLGNLFGGANFQKKRFQALQNYLLGLLQIFPVISAHPVMESYFGEDGPGRIVPAGTQRSA